MRKTIITLAGAAVLGMLASAPASAFAPLFFAPMLASKYDPNFKAVNPYEHKAVRHAKRHHAKKMAAH